MKEKIKIREAPEFPIWAWHTFYGKRKKPDLRKVGYAKSKAECVCIEIDIQDEWLNSLNLKQRQYVLEIEEGICKTGDIFIAR